MQTALSLSTGLIITCKDASYEDTNRLLLVCPFCKERVFIKEKHYREEHIRQKGEKLIYVKSAEVKKHFAHKETSLQCERKSEKHNITEITKHNNKSKNQRFNIFRMYFYRLIVDDIASYKKNKNVLLELLRVQNPTQIEGILRVLEQEIREETLIRFKYIIKSGYLLQRIKTLLDYVKGDYSFFPKERGIRDFHIKWINSMNLEVHLELINNVAEFLLTKSAKNLVLELIDVSLEAYVKYDKNNYFNINLVNTKQDTKKQIETIIDAMTIRLGTIDWSRVMLDHYNGELDKKLNKDESND